MGAIELHPRPLYGIGTVSRLTGIKPDTLRIWERRYQLGASYKSASGRRQYTQSDLEHLQLVAALVDTGTRIGEIASSERRTLEMLLRARRGGSKHCLPDPKPNILFVGKALCSWLDEHQGCLVNTNALLAPRAASTLDPAELAGRGGIDGIVLEYGSFGRAALEALKSIAGALGTSNVLVLHQCSNANWLSQLEQHGFSAAEFPPDPAFLAFHLTRSAAERTAQSGTGSLGELVQGKPRLFKESEICAMQQLEGALDSECRKRLADLVRALTDFEEHSSSCTVETWADASLHACVYAYAGQARWLMEKALGLVEDSHQDSVKPC